MSHSRFSPTDRLAQTFIRKENESVYMYGPRIAASFKWWSKMQRDKRTAPLFKDFYNQLASDQQKMIVVK